MIYLDRNYYARKRRDRALLVVRGGLGRFAKLFPGPSNFSVAYDAKRDVEVLSYTEPRGTRFEIEAGKVLRKNSPVKVSFELKRQKQWPDQPG